MIQRMIGVLKLDVNTFEEIESDTTATSQAAIIVVILALLSAVSAYFAAGMSNDLVSSIEGLGGSEIPASFLTMAQTSPVASAVVALLSALFSWFVLAATTYFIGTNVFGGKADLGEMLRVTGFAQTPRFLGVAGIIPCLGVIFSFVGWVWMLVATFIGIRQGLDLDNGKTAVTILISLVLIWVINLALGFITAMLF